MNVRGTLYRAIMKVSHKYNWHYAPPVYPDGDTLLWCQWCGFRQVVKRQNIIVGNKELEKDKKEIE